MPSPAVLPPASPLQAIVTRPEREALQWVQALRARGIAAAALPLIAIGPPPDLQALQAARARVQALDYRALMFVSGNAAQHFLDPDTALALASQALAAIKTRAWSPGPGTAQTLVALGVPAHLIDRPAHGAVQFDSESLWEQVHGQVAPGDRVLVVRGTEAGAAAQHGSGREWLAQQLQAAGARAEFAVAYTRGAPVFTAAQQALVQSALAQGALWLLAIGGPAGIAGALSLSIFSLLIASSRNPAPMLRYMPPGSAIGVLAALVYRGLDLALPDPSSATPPPSCSSPGSAPRCSPCGTVQTW